ncbi:DUF4006 family protein [Sulfurimonas sp. CVO]|jgi:hypothetical protein|uniref:DUF4006 family protein n=1 Tax=Sulfurimonas xiamenensis TaxID=2590021 RepID=A0AAJ4A525_9BACT|nr:MULTISPECIES: DUF4006 family protein [Sulfurimonas]QFR44040.1 DUF4006 family protein [Sulfurimonas xiamenensis]QHG90417.1 DUF4006 family protein [Sulfurimonas sp. CVO]
MNENRSIFSLDGITGMLIATILLLAILVFLSIWAVNVQQKSSSNFYDLKDETSIKMIGSKESDHIIDVK